MAKSLAPSKLEALKQAFKEGYAAILRMRVDDGDGAGLLGQLVKLSSKVCLSSSLALGSHLVLALMYFRWSVIGCIELSLVWVRHERCISISIPMFLPSPFARNLHSITYCFYMYICILVPEINVLAFFLSFCQL